MLIAPHPQGIQLTGRLQTLPIPLLFGLLRKANATGNLVLWHQHPFCQLAFIKGKIAGIQWQDNPLEIQGTEEKDFVAALAKQSAQLFHLRNETFAFTSDPNPTPHILKTEALPELFVLRYGLTHAPEELTKQLIEEAIPETASLSIPSTKGLQILGQSAVQTLEAYTSGKKVTFADLPSSEQLLLLTLWCAGSLTCDKPTPAHQRFQKITAFLTDLTPPLKQATEFHDPLNPASPDDQPPLELEPEIEEHTEDSELIITPQIVEAKPPTIPPAIQEEASAPHAIELLLAQMDTWRASDLFLAEDAPPALRVHGHIVTLDLPSTSKAQFNHFLQAALQPSAHQSFQESGDLDFGYSLSPTRRFRVNLHRQKGHLGLVARAIPSGALDFDDLGLPNPIRTLASIARGLVLVTGATGSGKSTTLAAMIHHINQTRPCHIVTIEEPIEFIHKSRKARITQREVGSDTRDFHTALRHVVRESPDVILIGEMRDADTMSVAISAALTGHLVFATLHTINATQTLQRIMSYYPEHLRHQVAMDLSLSLQGIISQRLVPNKDSTGRKLALEMLTCTPAVTQLLRQQRIDELTDLMRSSTDPGLLSFNRSLLELFRRGEIAYETGKAYATNPDEFALSAQGMETGIATFREQHPNDASNNLDMKYLLQLVLAQNASDLHLTTGRPPILRINGHLDPLPFPALSDADMRLLLFSILSVRQRSVYQIDREIDFAIALDNGQRFRVNAYHQKGKMAASLRTIPTRIPNPDELEIPKRVMKLVDNPHGLLLVVGPTGSGKSTTLACMIDRVNQTRACRIITIEDPIEFTHKSQKATIDQREVYADTKDFPSALKYVLRQDPDVILIGEMRDLETMTAAMTAAETGHLVLATLHTNSAIQTIDRIIDAFPSHQQPQIRSQLSACLLGVVSQRLLQRKDGSGRIAAFEVMLATPAIRHLIRDDKMHQAQSMLETSKAAGMVTMDEALKTLYQQQRISIDDALRYIQNPKILQRPSRNVAPPRS